MPSSCQRWPPVPLPPCHAPFSFFSNDCAVAACGCTYQKGTFSMLSSPPCWPPSCRCSRRKGQTRLPHPALTMILNGQTELNQAHYSNTTPERIPSVPPLPDALPTASSAPTPPRPNRAPSAPVIQTTAPAASTVVGSQRRRMLTS